MITRGKHRAGDFCWMDLSTTDLDAASDFYRSLFGWKIEPWPVTEGAEGGQPGGYRQITYEGAVIGGAMHRFDETDMPSWGLFFAVDDADEAAAKVTAAGGRLVVDPMAVPGGDRVAFFADPTGALCGIQELTGSAGVERTMDPNTVCWVEVGSRHPETTRSFYGDLFGWRFETPAAGEAADGYSLIYHGDGNLGGMIEMDGRFPEGIGSYWMIYVGVEDLRATLTEVESRGGHVGFGPTEIPDGTFAVVSDPQGAHFAVIQPSAEAMGRAGQAG